MVTFNLLVFVCILSVILLFLVAVAAEMAPSAMPPGRGWNS